MLQSPARRSSLCQGASRMASQTRILPPMRAILDIVLIVLNLYTWVLIASAVLSWLIAFNVVNAYNPAVRTIGDIVFRLTEPVLKPIRSILPSLGGIDLSPMVLILLISNAVQNAMVGPDTTLQGGLLAAAALFLVNFVLKKFLFRNQKLRDLILQKPEILIHDGKIDQAALNKLDLSLDELREAMREHGVQEFYQ
eukprot:gene1515-1752_t